MYKNGFATRAIHDGQPTDPQTGSVTVPLYLTSNFTFEEIERTTSPLGYEYTRLSNPTRTAAEQCLASLEGARTAHLFASGMAAIAALCTMMNSGDHIVCSDDVYGGTVRYFEHVLRGYGIDITYVDTSNAANVAHALRPQTKLVHIETPANPMMTITDIRAVADICHPHGTTPGDDGYVDLSVDNTFMSPYFQRPLEFGADIVMHSTTKFLNGHSDGIGGALLCSRDSLAERFRLVQKTTGGILAPFDCWLLLRGIKTLALRMREHEKNGRAVADFLSRHPAVQKLNYPGLPTHPQHALASRQMTGFGSQMPGYGSMMSLELGSRQRANQFLTGVRLCILAESLGGVETLVSHPATMTHVGFPQELKDRLGITEGLVRISVGIEDADDLIADLDQALSSLT